MIKEHKDENLYVPFFYSSNLMSKTFIDQLGNKLQIDFPPKRIISLVPSLTEFLFDLGLEDEIAGITRFCVHPHEKCKEKTRIGGTKNFDIEKIKEIRPDFILASKEENTKEGIEKLSEHFPVWVSDIRNLEDVFMMMSQIEKIFEKENKAKEIITSIRSGFSTVKSLEGKKSVAYFIWRKPYMTVGRDTFIHQMIEKIGLKNLFEKSNRYPEVKPGALSELNPDYIFLSSEPYPFSKKHIEEFSLISPNSKIILVDGEYFSWYGSRLLKSPQYFQELIKEL